MKRHSVLVCDSENHNREYIESWILGQNAQAAVLFFETETITNENNRDFFDHVLKEIENKVPQIVVIKTDTITRDAIPSFETFLSNVPDTVSSMLALSDAALGYVFSEKGMNRTLLLSKYDEYKKKFAQATIPERLSYVESIWKKGDNHAHVLAVFGICMAVEEVWGNKPQGKKVLPFLYRMQSYIAYIPIAGTKNLLETLAFITPEK